jgi:eukaryotic-like serine/threonine-protein kinase
MTREAAAESERSEHARSLIGQVVGGRWTILRLLGSGGMASVFEARHRNGRRAALKILHPAVAAQRTSRLRFLSEGYASNKVEHPGAVTVLDDGEDGDLVFLVMELLNGRSLADRLAADGPLEPAEVARVARAVLDVLAQAHDRGVVHRDIKPSNVFELASGEIKVLDFGVAQLREPGSLGLTDSGVAVGTPAFMAPEQAGGRTDEVSPLTDVWAVGATMFRLLTGAYVHDVRTPNAALVAAATTPARRVGSLRPDVPEPLQAVVDRALAFQIDDRFPNARAMQRAIEHAVGATAQVEIEDDSRTLAEVPPMHEAERPRRRSLAVAFVLLALGAGSFGLWRRFGVDPAPAERVPSSPAEAEQPPPVTRMPAAPPLVARPDADASATPATAPSTSAAVAPSSTPVRPRPVRRPQKASASDSHDSLIETRQ